MKIRMMTSAVSLAAALVLAVGCNRESPKGGPGADKANKGATTGSNDKTNTFSIEVPSGNTNITQGEQKEINISIDRGDNFNQDVKLTFKTPEGVQVTPDSVTVKKGADDAKITVKAADTAPVGTTNVKVTGTPATGSAAAVDLGIEIKKKS